MQNYTYQKKEKKQCSCETDVELVLELAVDVGAKLDKAVVSGYDSVENVPVTLG